MKFFQNAEDSESRIRELSAALEEAERKLAEREMLVAEALDQTEAARGQYEHANARAETLHRYLTAKEEQVSALQLQLRQRDDRIAALEQPREQSREQAREQASANGTTLHDGIQQGNIGQLGSSIPAERLVAMGLALESLEQPGTLYKITSATTTIGRTATNDIAVDSNSVSRFHARILVKTEGVFLIDLESTNGCKVNGKRISRQMIGNADEISIGSVKFKFSVGASSEEVDARAMQETHVLLDESIVFSPIPQAKPGTTQQGS